MSPNWHKVQNRRRSITAACLEGDAHPEINEGTCGKLIKQMYSPVFSDVDQEEAPPQISINNHLISINFERLRGDTSSFMVQSGRHV